MRLRIPIVALVGSIALSELANVVILLTIPWMVYETTGSATSTGVAVFFTAVTNIGSSLVGGVWVDRLGGRRMALLADAASAVTVALIPVLIATIGLQFWWLVILIIAGALLDAPGALARIALIPQVAERSGVSLERINAAVEGVRSGAALVGAPLAGALLAFLGHERVLWVSAGAFVVSFGAMAALRDLRSDAPAEAAPPAPMWSEVTAGLRWIAREPLIRVVVIAMAALNLVLLPVAQVAMPVAVNTLYGSPLNLGFIVGAHGVGLLAGSLLFGAFARRIPRRFLFLVSLLAAGAPAYAFASLAPFVVALTAGFVNGLAIGTVRPLFDTVMHRRLPPELRGRVFGATYAVSSTAQPIGMLTVGVLLDQAGLQGTLVGMSALYVTAVIILASLPALQLLDVGDPMPSPDPNVGR